MYVLSVAVIIVAFLNERSCWKARKAGKNGEGNLIQKQSNWIIIWHTIHKKKNNNFWGFYFYFL